MSWLNIQSNQCQHNSSSSRQGDSVWFRLVHDDSDWFRVVEAGSGWIGFKFPPISDLSLPLLLSVSFIQIIIHLCIYCESISKTNDCIVDKTLKIHYVREGLFCIGMLTHSDK